MNNNDEYLILNTRLLLISNGLNINYGIHEYVILIYNEEYMYIYDKYIIMK